MWQMGINNSAIHCDRDLPPFRPLRTGDSPQKEEPPGEGRLSNLSEAGPDQNLMMAPVIRTSRSLSGSEATIAAPASWVRTTPAS